MKKYNLLDLSNIPALSFQSLFIIIILIFIFNLIYVYSTKFKKTITVDEKHTYGSNNAKGSQSISDTNNNVYVLKDSLYVLHWTSVEVFNKLDEITANLVKSIMQYMKTKKYNGPDLEYVQTIADAFSKKSTIKQFNKHAVRLITTFLLNEMWLDMYYTLYMTTAQ